MNWISLLDSNMIKFVGSEKNYYYMKSKVLSFTQQLVELQQQSREYTGKFYTWAHVEHWVADDGVQSI